MRRQRQKGTPLPTKDRLGGSVLSVGAVRKADTQALITNGADAFPEDSFNGQYWTGSGSTSGVSILEPQYKPGTLYALASQNNSLLQCIEAMEVNIDGTGHSIDPVDEAKKGEDSVEKKRLEDFFREPYPGKTFPEIRRDIRRDRATTGNGYMEVIRSADDEVVMLNHLDAVDMRLVRLDDPVVVSRTLVRDGKELSLQLRTRERRFVQIVNGKKVFFKEFGSERDLDRNTGEWAEEKKRLPLEQRASEVIHFVANKEPKTPYGTPQWINQLPSVLGSRKAEEHNLEFFDSGGLPPVLVIVEGGTLGETMKNDLRQHLSGAGNKHRAAVVEAVSTSGSLDSSGSVKVRVERFGAERQQDAMFQSYDKNSKDHVRSSFRLPPLFIGEAADYNFATAYTAYMVAEAQVFYPERDEFDGIINNKICRALGAKDYKFRSLPMTLVDVEKQLEALNLGVTNNMVKKEGVVKALNEITGVSLEFEEPPEPPAIAPNAPQGGPGASQGVPASPKAVTPSSGVPAAARPATPIAKEEMELLASRLAVIASIKKGEVAMSETYSVFKRISEMDESELATLSEFMTADLLGGNAELCGCGVHNES